ncbi:hypothetical protein [Agromyces sp. NPDC049794]|uniref:hypothetical protein n=1 Tax=unclassified Agromyces TaxID=2639701 RepID=UPI0033E4E277
MGERDSERPVEDAGEQGSQPERRMPLRPPSLDDDDDAPPPPPRPPLTDETKPPVLRAIPTPRVVKTARTLWILSFVLGGAGVFIAFLSRDAIVDELTERLGRLAPGYDADEVATLVDVVYWSSIAGLGLIITIEAVLLGSLMNRRGGARWLQLIVLVVHAGAALVGSAFLAIGDRALLVAALLVAGFLLCVVAWILCLVPAANRWFRMQDEAQRALLD